MKNYYKILGINEDASKSEIKKAYIKLAKKYHPDKLRDNNDEENIFADISEAYAVLSDENKKRKYDEELKQYKQGIDIEKKQREEKFEKMKHRAKIAIKREEYERAYKYLEKIIEFYNYSKQDISPELKSLMGLTMIALGKNQNKALELLDNAITDTMFNDDNIILNMAQAYFILGDKKKGREFLKKALKINPRNKRAIRLKKKYDYKKRSILSFIFRR